MVRDYGGDVDDSGGEGCMDESGRLGLFLGLGKIGVGRCLVRVDGFWEILIEVTVGEYCS